MPIYKNLIKVESLEKFYWLYEFIDPEELPGKIKMVICYLRDGYKYAENDNDLGCKKMDISRHTDLIHSLYICTSEMLDKKTSGLYIHLEDGKRINMEPFFEFLDRIEHYDDIIDDFEELGRVLENYLNDTKVKEFTASKKVVGEIHFLLSSIHRELVKE